MPRHVNPKVATRKIVELLTALIKSEVARSPVLEARAAAAKAAARPKRGAPDAKPRRKLKLSPKVRQMRKQQGQFMGLIRGLPAAKKAEIKKLRKEKGYPSAIAAARAAGKKAA